MNSNSKLSAEVLSAMNNFLENEKYIGTIAHPKDIFFINDGSWLKDTAVIDMVIPKNGAWDVTLVFAHYKNPFQLLIRNITTCFSKQKALASAFYMRKEAAKDRRGTLIISIDELNLCNN